MHVDLQQFRRPRLSDLAQRLVPPERLDGTADSRCGSPLSGWWTGKRRAPRPRANPAIRSAVLGTKKSIRG